MCVHMYIHSTITTILLPIRTSNSDAQCSHLHLHFRFLVSFELNKQTNNNLVQKNLNPALLALKDGKIHVPAFYYSINLTKLNHHKKNGKIFDDSNILKQVIVRIVNILNYNGLRLDSESEVLNKSNRLS